MKEEKMAMCIGKATNRTNWHEAVPNQSYARTRFSLLVFEFSFQFPSAALLLNWMMAVIGSLYSITNRTVCNKYINILGIV